MTLVEEMSGVGGEGSVHLHSCLWLEGVCCLKGREVEMVCCGQVGFRFLVSSSFLSFFWLKHSRKGTAQAESNPWPVIDIEVRRCWISAATVRMA